jgi:ABC-type Mn2+/Zn2+ transport system ATPase subunit
VPGIFDEAMLLNVRRIAAGPVGTVLTPANLARAYGVTFTPKVAAVVGG